jgi:hypothetical protein
VTRARRSCARSSARGGATAVPGSRAPTPSSGSDRRRRRPHLLPTPSGTETSSLPGLKPGAVPPRAPSALLLVPQRSDRVVPRVRGDEPGEVRLLEVRPHRRVRAIGHGEVEAAGRSAVAPPREPREREQRRHQKAPGRAARPPRPATGTRARRHRAALGVAASCGLMDVNTDARRRLSELASRRFLVFKLPTQTVRPVDARVVATCAVPSEAVKRCLRGSSSNSFARCLPSRRGRPADGHSRGARGRRIFGARTRERAISIASTSSARALSRSAPTRSPSSEARRDRDKSRTRRRVFVRDGRL